MATTKVYAETVRDLGDLNHYAAELAADLKAIQAERMLSTEYKKELTARKRAQWTESAKIGAASIWGKANRRVDAARRALDDAERAKDEGMDWQKFNGLVQEYGARLRSNRPDLAPGSALRSLVAQAGQSREGRRALAIVAQDIAYGADGLDYADIRATLRSWETEAQAPAEAARLELAHAEVGRDEIRRAILRLEEQTTGVPRYTGLFANFSDWQREVLGETPMSAGRITWRGDEVAAVGGGVQEGGE